MSLSSKTEREITELLTTTIREKLSKYKPETVHMPFHHRLLGKDRYAMFSFVQSMNTTFGISIWEQVAVIIAKGAGNLAERQYKLLGEIDGETEELIRKIHYKLRKGETTANKIYEVVFRSIREITAELVKREVKISESVRDAPKGVIFPNILRRLLNNSPNHVPHRLTQDKRLFVSDGTQPNFCFTKTSYIPGTLDKTFTRENYNDHY